VSIGTGKKKKEKEKKGEQFQDSEVCKTVIFPATDLVIEVILEDSDV
jgi:hypothetical protein